MQSQYSSKIKSDPLMAYVLIALIGGFSYGVISNLMRLSRSPEIVPLGTMVGDLMEVTGKFKDGQFPIVPPQPVQPVQPAPQPTPAPVPDTSNIPDYYYQPAPTPAPQPVQPDPVPPPVPQPRYQEQYQYQPYDDCYGYGGYGQYGYGYEAYYPDCGQYGIYSPIYGCE